jgi:hypothetical protein
MVVVYERPSPPAGSIPAAEFARRIGAVPMTVRNWAAAGRITATKVDGLWYVSPEAFAQVEGKFRSRPVRPRVTPSRYRIAKTLSDWEGAIPEALALEVELNAGHTRRWLRQMEHEGHTTRGDDKLWRLTLAGQHWLDTTPRPSEGGESKAD